MLATALSLAKRCGHVCAFSKLGQQLRPYSRNSALPWEIATCGSRIRPPGTGARGSGPSCWLCERWEVEALSWERPPCSNLLPWTLKLLLRTHFTFLLPEASLSWPRVAAGGSASWESSWPASREARWEGRREREEEALVKLSSRCSVAFPVARRNLSGACWIVG